MPTSLNISLQSTESSVIKFEIPSELEAALQGTTTDSQPNISFVTTGERGAKGDAGTADVPVGGIVTNLIANGAVTNTKIGTAAVSNSKLTNNAISAAKIQNNAVTTDKIANNAITADKIAPGVVTSELLADGVISSNKLGQGSISENKLDNGCVTASKIASNAITKAKIAARTLSGQEIEENVVLDGAKINGSFQLLGSSPATLKGPNHDILNIHSERDLVFKVDSNNNQNSSYLFKNGAGVTVFSIDESGNVTINGTIDGRDLAVDGAKLDGISNSEIIDWSVAQTENIHPSNYTDTNTQLPLIDDDTMATASSTNVASAESVKAYVDNEVAGIVDSAPGTLDTLNELADALGDDANFSTTVTNNIATKAPIASPTFTGTVAIPNISDVESAITANTAKTGITTQQATDITTNNSKTSFPGFGTTSGTALEGDTALLQLGTTSTTALAGDTTTISSAQASAITANTAKVGITTSQADAITANTAKTSFPGFGTTAGTALEGNTTIPTQYTDSDAVSALAAADNYIRNDAGDVMNGSLEINDYLFINKLGGGSKVRFRNNSTTGNRTLDVPDADGTIMLVGNKDQVIQVSLRDHVDYMFYMFNHNYWYSAGASTLAVLGNSTSPSNITAANSEYQSRVAAYTAVENCVLEKMILNFYWSSSAISGDIDIEFAFSKFTPIQDGTAAIITINDITATDCDDAYTEAKPYQKTFTFSGNNAALSAGDAFGFHMRTINSQNSQRVLVYASAVLQLKLT